MTDISLADLGLSASSESALSSEHLRRLAATIDAPPPSAGASLPLLWHWAFFTPETATSGLGADGHPGRTSALLADFPRRMWVGGRVTAVGDLVADLPATQRTRLVATSRKSGSTGELLFVELEHVVEQDGEIRRTERQDVVYRAAGGVTPPPGESVAFDETLPSSTLITPTETLLFRFSAITFNSHRIHYDQAYATAVEHYPGLVVHGPLTAMLLAEAAHHRLDRPLGEFEFRARSPLFVDQPFQILVADGDGDDVDAVSMTAVRGDGSTAMSATAR